MMANRVAMLGLAVALGATQVGCTDPCSFNNGKRKVLSFYRVSESPARGLETMVLMPTRSWTMFKNPFAIYTRDPSTCLVIDQDNDEIEVVLPESLQSPPAVVLRHLEEDVNMGIRFTCGATTADPQEVIVRVTHEGVVHEDAFDVVCQRLGQARAEIASTRPTPSNGFAVGGELAVRLFLSDPAGNPLSGRGVVPLDGLLVPAGEPTSWLDTLDRFVVAAPGQDPRIQIASFQATLNARLVAGSEWNLAIEIRSNPTTPQVFDISAWPATATENLNGLVKCRWTAVTAAGSEVLPATTCDIQQGRTPPSGSGTITQICVEGLGRSACVPMPT